MDSAIPAPRAETYDAIMVGGGFYGCAIAGYLARRGWRVALLEREAELMTRASFVNQARLHNGYHYPRSFRTASRSRVNLDPFRRVFPEAVFDKFRALYAIARHGSKISPAHFERFGQVVGMPMRPASKEDAALFDSRLIERVYEVEEPAFDASILRQHHIAELDQLGVEVLTQHQVESIQPLADEDTASRLKVSTGSGVQLIADWVFNCTYADLNHVYGEHGGHEKVIDRFGLVHQIAEVALFEPPPELASRGVTVMDGPFFSAMPFPALGLHSLTHVRYTHHAKWNEDGELPFGLTERCPTALLHRYLETGGGKLARSRFAWMVRDAARYLPALSGVPLADTLIDVKTLAVGTQVDDARPILMHRDDRMGRLVSVMGGKVDNIFDIFEFIEQTLGLGVAPHTIGAAAHRTSAPAPLEALGE
jgi:glycine/D-amino acid oxidase-like deaminating enzyme